MSYAYGMGNLSSLPNISMLTTDIQKYMEQGNKSYFASHDILFTKSINIRDYCKFIIINTNIDNEEYMSVYGNVINMAQKFHIPILFNGKHAGLNNIYSIINQKSFNY